MKTQATLRTRFLFPILLLLSALLFWYPARMATAKHAISISGSTGKVTAAAAQNNSPINVCGRVKGYTASTYATAGKLQLDARNWAIAPGIEIKGAMQLSPEADVCLNAAVNSSGQITSPNSVTANQSAGNQVCGALTSYVPATSTEQGLLTIGEMSFTIAQGVALQGVQTGASVCLNLCLDAAGRIIGVSSVTVTGTGGVSTICGFVTAFSSALGGQQGSLTIGGLTFAITPGVLIVGQNLAMPGAYLCLTPVIADGHLVSGSLLSPSTPAALQFTTPAIVNGTTGIYGPPYGVDQFLLPQPVIFTVDSPAPAGTSVFAANSSNFGQFYPLDGTTAGGLMLSTPNSSARALTCTDSFWDGNFQLASSGETEGDMVTFSLQNPNGTNSQVVAMLTMTGGGAKITQLHKDVILYWGPGGRTVGTVIPLMVPAGSAGMRTPALTMAFSPSSPTLNGCFQLVAEIKRASGEGKTTLVISSLQVKRMATPGDPVVNIGTGLFSGSLGWYPTGKVCDFACTGCAVIPVQPPSSLSGTVFCDNNDDGIQQAGDSGLGGVTVTLTGSQGSQSKSTDSGGHYIFDNLPPGTYKITETQPSGVMGDGKDTAGSLGGDVTNDMIANIVLPANGSGTGYNFAEICAKTSKCDTICWRSSQYFVTFIRNLPGGTVLIPGVNANNPVGIQQNLNTIRSVLQGGPSPMQQLSKEYVTGQLSIAGAGGQGSPVTFNTFWSPLRCSGVSFGEITLSTGFKFTPDSLLNDLVEQTVLAVKNNQSADYAALASIWAMLNGRC